MSACQVFRVHINNSIHKNKNCPLSKKKHCSVMLLKQIKLNLTIQKKKLQNTVNTTLHENGAISRKGATDFYSRENSSVVLLVNLSKK